MAWIVMRRWGTCKTWIVSEEPATGPPEELIQDDKNQWGAALARMVVLYDYEEDGGMKVVADSRHLG